MLVAVECGGRGAARLERARKGSRCGKEAKVCSDDYEYRQVGSVLGTNQEHGYYVGTSRLVLCGGGRLGWRWGEAKEFS